MSEKQLSPLKAIRAHCIECSGGSVYEVKLCPVTKCNLYAFRSGKRPGGVKRELTDEQRAVLSERMKKAQAAKKAKSEEQGA